MNDKTAPATMTLTASPFERVIGALICAVGVLVMAGWWMKSQMLVQLSPDFEPMKFNSGLLFALCGAGLFGRGRMPWRVTATLGAAVVVVGLLVLFEYVFSTDLGIDTLFAEPFIAKRTEFPGRFAINSAVAFVLSGATLFLAAVPPRNRYTPLIVALLGSLIAALGIAPLFGYLTGTQDYYIWGMKIGMAAHTAMSFVLLGVCFMSMSWRRGASVPSWAPVPVFLMLVALTFALTQAVVNDDDRRLHTLVAAEARSAADDMQQYLTSLYGALGRMGDRWDAEGGTPETRWEKDATAYLHDFAALKALVWADKQNHLQWMVTLKAVKKIPNFNIAFEPERANAIEAAKKTGKPQMTKVVPFIQGGKGFIYFVPLSAHGAYDGELVAAFEVGDLLDAALSPRLQKDYTIVSEENGESMFGAKTETPTAERVSAVAEVSIANQHWRFTLFPTAAVVASKKSSLPAVTLVIGLFVSALTALTFYFSIRMHDARLRLRYSNDQLAYFIKHMPAAVAICDRDMRYLMVSDRWYSDFRVKEASIIGKSHYDVFHAMPLRWRSILSAAIETGASSSDEDKIELKGKPFWLHWDVRPWRQPDGAIGGIIMATEIVTARKESEEALKAAKALADGANRAKTEFLASMNHELRTPLTSIRGALGLIDGGALGPVSERVGEMVKRAFNNSERLSRLINDILDLEKIEAGKMQINISPFIVGPALRQSVEANHMYAAKFRVRYELQSAPDDIEVMADPDRLLQVLANLLSNAAKFSPEGGVVEVRAGLRKGRVRYEVQDHGIGIAPQFRNRIFEKFSQAEATDDRKREGTGLGLSIAKHLVEEMGGTIGFDTEEGKGTTFFFDLPGYRVAIVRDGQEGRPAAGSVLICEDEKGTSEYMRFLLGRAGFTADIARSVDEARRRIEGHSYSAVTLDLKLADGSSGADFLRELRSNDATRDLPVVIVSANAADAKQDLSGGALNVADWLVKPFDADRIVHAVREAVTGSRMPVIMHVEDDWDLSAFVEAALHGKAEVVHAYTVKEAKHMLTSRAFDLVILDVGMPDGSGLDLLEQLPRLPKVPPVLILSASETTADVQKRVAAALVKSKISEDKVVETILSLLGPGAKAAKPKTGS